MTNVIQKKILKVLLYFSPLYKYKISGDSMSPTLHNGQIVLVNRFIYLFAAPKKNDIIAVRDPRDGKVLIKRIKKIEDKRYFVLGDNKKASTDSRVFGMIERQDIVGKVWLS
ncbi:MAG TPA: nickel-type superoxide dismutase maturation protease [Candidatus Acidoferrales bacterium]|nr:nickel-type superoxide dismutase maturation protease [Candidatus Acidoferrales bacterium]